MFVNFCSSLVPPINLNLYCKWSPFLLNNSISSLFILCFLFIFKAAQHIYVLRFEKYFLQNNIVVKVLRSLNSGFYLFLPNYLCSYNPVCWMIMYCNTVKWKFIKFKNVKKIKLSSTEKTSWYFKLIVYRYQQSIR